MEEQGGKSRVKEAMPDANLMLPVFFLNLRSNTPAIICVKTLRHYRIFGMIGYHLKLGSLLSLQRGPLNLFTCNADQNWNEPVIAVTVDRW